MERCHPSHGWGLPDTEHEEPSSGSWPLGDRGHLFPAASPCRRYLRGMRRTATGAVLLATMLLAGSCGSNGTTGEPAPAAPSSATSSPTSSPTSAVLTCTNAAVPLV